MSNLTEIHNSTGLMENGTLSPAVTDQIVDFFSFVSELKKKEAELKEMLLDEMEKNGVIQIDIGKLLISYVPATDRESLDTKLLKKECPDVYNEYVKISEVKSSVRVKVR